MKHKSIPISEIEFINIDNSISPLISKCQIKVCYVGDTPNRNKTVITKELAKEIAKTLPGCPIVGYYNQNDEDYEEHNRVISISNGKFTIKDNTIPYGFVDLNAKCWFQKFEDDDQFEREYLVTEGYLWTEQFPEAQRIIERGNNQSMQFDEKTLKGNWTKDTNGNYKFFIINEAIMSKLCILGENYEPCFEGSSITSFSLDLDAEFKEKMYSMMENITKILNEKGGQPMFTAYAVSIGDSLWESLNSYMRQNFPVENDTISQYRVNGVFLDGENKYAVLVNKEDSKCYRMNFSFDAENNFNAEELIDITDSYSLEENSQFTVEEIENYEAQYKKKEKEPEEEPKSEEKSEEKSEDENKEEKPEDEDEDEEKKKKKKDYSLDEIPEYVELNNNYSTLQNNYSALQATYDQLKADNDTLNIELASLREFKLAAERENKKALIEKFYMLSDEDKSDVITNIDTYSLDEIESKLAVACFRNKISFNEEEDNDNNNGATVYNLNGTEAKDEATPAWVKLVQDVAKRTK